MLTTIVVTSLADADSPGTITLRDAIDMSVTNPGTSSDPVVITFQSGLSGTIPLNGNVGAMNLSTGVTQIEGPGASLITVSGQGTATSTALFDVVGDADVTISGLSIADGDNAGGYGGGIYVSGATLNVNNCVFAQDAAGDVRGGGGIFADYGSTILNVNDCTFTDNSALAGPGGAILNEGTTVISNSTFTGNSAGTSGGACYDNANSLTIINSTFQGNSAGSGGGGAVGNSVSETNVVVDDSTVVGNSALVGGGGIEDYSSFILNNTIVAENTVGNSENDVSGPLTLPSGYNFIGDGSGGLTSSDGNILGSAENPIDPDLGMLADNGGPTQTLLPATGSPVIGAGSVSLIPSGVSTDQLGLSRTLNGAVDIGSVEVGGVAVVNAPTKLVFAGQPSNAIVGASLGEFDVDVENASGDIVSTDSSSVTLSASPATALGGTTTVTALGGVATFSNVTINQAGDYTLTATDGSLTSATSSSVVIAPVSVVTPTIITGAKIPTTAVAGQPFSARIPIKLTNQGARLSGKFGVDIYVNTLPNLNGTQVLVGSFSHKASIKSGKSISLVATLKSLPVTLPGGTYYLLVAVNDPRNEIDLVSSTQTVQIAAPALDVAGAVTSVTFPSLLKRGTKHGSVIFTLTNTGNVPLGTDGPFTFNVGVLDPATGLPVMMALVKKSLKLKVGQTVKVKLTYVIADPTVFVELGDMPEDYDIAISTEGPSSSGTPVTGQWEIGATS